ncbi:MAG TPA: CheR family methyltransferase [Pyrinomonadaceae bacterium]|nr:CheR family methyltransferase [Pyrinomonadaceae bacterium]
MATKKTAKPGNPERKLKDSSSTDGNGDLVVVGSSAGGVTALSVFVNTLSTEFPAPIVLAQHLDPQRASHLATILERHSKLPIVTVSESGPTPLQKGTIYVVPANRHVTIQDSHVRLEGESDGRPIPSVDRLLSTAATAYGEHLIAVILTGSGSDGAAGAVEVKEAGGLVIIQNPKSAPYPSMPQSLPPTVVDHVVEIEQIGPLLSDLLKGIGLTSEKVEDPLRDLLTFVSQNVNMDFRNYKPSTLLRRISRRMAIVHAQNLRDYDDYVRAHLEEVTELVKGFLINVTGFFRDREAFDFLKDFVVPDLLERGRENGRILRAWSAGCSTGEEAYSIAILLAEVLGSEISDWNIRIFATDLDEEAVGFARRGFYPTKLLDDLPADLIERYFEKIDHGQRVSKSIRQMVIFGNQDLTRGVPFPRMDLVVCRNLLIYLKPELQRDILDLFAYSLHQTHGYLFLGKAETAPPSKATFELVNKKWKVYHCVSGPMVLPAHGKPLNARQAEWQAITRRIDAADRQTPSDEITPLRRINEVMFRYLPIGIAVIDHEYRIVTVNAAARRLLGIRDLASEQDFLHTSRGLPYTQVRDAIDGAFTDHSTATLNDIASESGSGRFLTLTVMPAHIDDSGSQLAVITVTDVTETVITKRRLEDAQGEQTKLLEELGSTNKRLTSMNTELQEANEELQTANEELMLTQEELQATNEEFEATNEELQATNEELETNNEELQATNEELQTTNDELTARSHELQELARELNAARERLDHMVQQFPYWVMVASGPELQVTAYSARYALLFGDKNVRGTPIEKVFAGEGVADLLSAARKALSENTTVLTSSIGAHVPDDEALGSEFVHIIVPIPASDGNADGVIIFTENITERNSQKNDAE